MEGIRSYALAIVTVCVSAGLVTQIAPEGQLKKYIKYIISLCVLAALIAPVISVFGGLPEYADKFGEILEQQTEDDSGAKKQLIETQKNAVQEAIRSLISTKYSIKKENIEVKIKINSDNSEAVEIKEIFITVKEYADIQAIKNYINEMFYGTAKITVMEADGG